MSNLIEMGNRTIGHGNKPLFLPDIGTFFNQDIDMASGVIKTLIESDVEVVKGEILHTPDVCLKAECSEKYFGWKSKKVIEENYRELIERKVVSLDKYEQLFQKCKDSGIDFLVSVYDKEGADFAKEIGAISLKIASSNITHYPLIKYISTMGLPLIIDTGLSSLEEISRAINWAMDAKCKNIIIEHSPAGPPAPVANHNLMFMHTLSNMFGVPYGLSDHHAGEEMLYAATVLGASVLEKGVCRDDVGDEQDTGHALPLSKVKDVLQKIDNIYSAVGDGIRYLPRNREKKRARMGLVANQDLAPGDIITDKNITFSWPAKGIEVEFYEQVIGWEIRKALAKGDVISWADICNVDT